MTSDFNSDQNLEAQLELGRKFVQIMTRLNQLGNHLRRIGGTGPRRPVWTKYELLTRDILELEELLFPQDWTERPQTMNVIFPRVSSELGFHNLDK
jgi:hypothetical protein